MPARFGLTAMEVALILALGGPPILVHMLDYVTATSSRSYRRDLMAFDLFCGWGGIWSACRRHDLQAGKYDISEDKSMDFRTTLGYLICLQYMLRLQVGSLFWSGLPCSLHVWVSRGTSGKTRSNPRGNPDKHDCTKEANMIAARFALCILICLARGVWWICEQPVSSVAMYLHYIEHAIYPARTMLGFQAGFIQKFWMGLFGHRSLKRTVIFGDAPFIHMFSLAARVTQADREKHQWSSDGNMKVTVNKSTGKKSVSGGPKLKDTQSYPIRFCSRIAEYFKKYCVETKMVPQRPDEHQQSQGPHYFVRSNFWDDAGLEDFVEFLIKKAHEKKFKPREGLPLRVAPLSAAETDVYFAMLHPTPLKKRKGQ